jgi:hypothetical protein
MKRNRIFSYAIIGLFLFGLSWFTFSAAAQGPGGITSAPVPTTVAVEPEEDGYVVYAPISKGTSDDSGSDDGAQLSLKLLVTNTGGAALHLTKTVVKFDGPPFAAGAAFDTDVVIAPGKTTAVHLQDNLGMPDVTFNFKLSDPAPPHVFIELKFAGYGGSVNLVRPLKAHRNSTPDGSYLFPAKASDLGRGEFWSGSSNGIGQPTIHRNDERFAHDMGVIRWNSTTGKWTGLVFDPNSPTKEKSGKKNEDYLCWGKEVYAVARGQIIKITRDKPDHEPGGENQGANQVQILVGDEIVQYLHLQKDSIPATLQEGDAVFAGQFLGLVGDSGKSSQPHLHIDVVSATGQHLRPVLFHQIYLIDRSELVPTQIGNSPWVAVYGKSLPWVKDAIWPSATPPQ